MFQQAESLLHTVAAVQGSDTTGDAISTKAGLKKSIKIKISEGSKRKNIYKS
jgi:hypothetical protein